MDLNSIRRHWQESANQHGTKLSATTKTPTAKAMELDALTRSLSRVQVELGDELSILEVGCGNGRNCLSLLEKFPKARFLGIDFIPEMVESADLAKKELGISDERLQFAVGDVMHLSIPLNSFDIVFTDRCLINLNSDELQAEAIVSLATLLRPGGHMVLVENCKLTYDNQNDARELLGLSRRVPAEFNHFINESNLHCALALANLELLETEDFISLHDLILYVLVPKINGGKIEYDHPLVAAATKLNIAWSAKETSRFGHFGQNRLYHCRKLGDR